MNKESLKAKEVLVPFMKEIYDEIYEDWGTGFDVPSEHLHTHLLFLRFNEIFQSIMLLLEKGIVVPAAMQLRPLTEAFIFLKSSVRDDDFHSRCPVPPSLTGFEGVNPT